MKVRALLIAAVLFCSARHAHAQDSVSDVLSFLLTNQAVQTDDFVKDQEAGAATRDTLSRFLLVELATLPIGSSSGGFVYSLNPTLGTMQRTSEAFGPFFLERAFTLGRKQMSLGFTYRYSRFDELDGRPLRDGTLVTTANRFEDEPAPFDVETLALRMHTSTFTLVGSYGVSDRLDVGVAVPVVKLDVSGERMNVYRGRELLQASATASVTGLADIAVRSKYKLVDAGGGAVAAEIDLRLPTGKEENLLGAGRAAARFSGVASVERERWGSHFKGGYAVGGVSRELQLAGGVVWAATPRLSVVGETFARRLDALARIAEVTAPHPEISRVLTTRLSPQATGTTTVTAVAGVKVNIHRTWLLNANVLFPLTDNGLTARPTPTIALDYTFNK